MESKSLLLEMIGRRRRRRKEEKETRTTTKTCFTLAQGEAATMPMRQQVHPRRRLLPPWRRTPFPLLVPLNHHHYCSHERLLLLLLLHWWPPRHPHRLPPLLLPREAKKEKRMTWKGASLSKT
jgi:hypothetical protein